MPDLVDRAWAAGLFEGEGSFYLLHSKKYLYASTDLGSTDRDVLDRFHGVLGFGNIREHNNRNPNWKNGWKWSTAKFENVQMVACLFWDQLGERRKKQIADTLLAVRNHRTNGGSNAFR